MPFAQAGPLRFYQFETLLQPGISHAIFTRHGGVSPSPWNSLNVGGTVGDDRERVIANRLRAFAALRRDPASLYDVWQVHSADVIHALAPRGEAAPVKADALITDDPKLTLFMRFADCVPILLFDPPRHAVAIAHAGWLGTVRKIAQATVQAMVHAFGTRPQDLRAAIGPSIGPDHYPVGDEVVEQVRESFGARADAHLHSADGRVRFDLWSANSDLLADEGVGVIEVARICTACHPVDWFSHRAEQGKTGRFGALIALEA